MTNYKHTKPVYAGQKIQYKSPHCSAVILTDIAERDRYGRLIWTASTPTIWIESKTKHIIHN